MVITYIETMQRGRKGRCKDQAGGGEERRKDQALGIYWRKSANSL